MDNQQKGFTMVELIVVITILGILAAIAVPRFISQTSRARIASLNGLKGAIHSATSLTQAEYIASGYNSNSTATSISMNGAPSVTVVAGSGNPAATAAGIGTALQTLSGFTPTYASGVATYNFSTTIANCNLTYTEATGAVALTTSGC